VGIFCPHAASARRPSATGPRVAPADALIALPGSTLVARVRHRQLSAHGRSGCASSTGSIPGVFCTRPAHRPALTRPCPAPRRCRPRPTGAAPGSVGAARHRPPVARAQTGKTHDTGSAPGVTQASVAAAAPRCPCTLTRLLAPRTLPYVVAPDFVDLYCDILTILFYTPAHSRCSQREVWRDLVLVNAIDELPPWCSARQYQIKTRFNSRGAK